MHCDPYHLTDTVVVDDFDFVDLDTGKGPGITTLEEDVDGGGNVEATADVKGDLVVPENIFA
jgi:hypothetical protein